MQLIGRRRWLTTRCHPSIGELALCPNQGGRRERWQTENCRSALRKSKTKTQACAWGSHSTIVGMQSASHGKKCAPCTMSHHTGLVVWLKTALVIRPQESCSCKCYLPLGALIRRCCQHPSIRSHSDVRLYAIVPPLVPRKCTSIGPTQLPLVVSVRRRCVSC